MPGQSKIPITYIPGPRLSTVPIDNFRYQANADAPKGYGWEMGYGVRVHTIPASSTTTTVAMETLLESLKEFPLLSPCPSTCTCNQ